MGERVALGRIADVLVGDVGVDHGGVYPGVPQNVLQGADVHAVMVGYGDTRVLCCVTAAPRPRDGIDFFPLSVDFEEKMYSVGRIPGSFNRREGRPGEKGILTSRVIDRPIRPLFPYDFRNDVSVMCTVMAVDHDCSPEIAALIGTSAALAISDIPWNGPVAALKVGLVDGKLVFNPDAEQRKVSDLDVTVVSTGKN